MRLRDLVTAIEARVLVAGSGPGPEIKRVFAGDRMSDLLSHSADGTLLVTGLKGRAMPRLFELMDIPGICLVDDVEPDPELVAAAEANRSALLVSPHGMFETCGRLYGALKAES